MTDFRILFSKTDALIYISHLDLTHTFVRALHRADISLRYSQGFNPHPKIVFALPLSVGMAGENELVDISLEQEGFSAETLKTLLGNAMPKDIKIKQIYEPDQKFKNVVSADYKISFNEVQGLEHKIKEALSSELIVTKTTKSGEKQIDIFPLILGFSLSEQNGDTILNITLAASSESYLNPEYVVTGLREKQIILSDNYFISRQKINFGDEHGIQV
jgi:Uncharacterized protein conserved in bacteria